MLTAAVALSAAPLTLSALDPDQEGLADVVFQLDGQGDPVPDQTAGRAVMDQRDKQFAPHVLSVRTGTAVSFPNSDNIRHQVYSFSPAKRFELPLYHGTQADPVVFDKSGVVVLGCNIHDGMIGYILVNDSDWHVVSGADGKARLDLPAGKYRLSAWHPLATQQPDTREIVVAPTGTTATVNFGALKPDPRKIRNDQLDNPFRRRAFDAP